tara:strand:- start:5427 stop:6263 length:837 start_codon:yes stop_codon:yes gene_type:complete
MKRVALCLSGKIGNTQGKSGYHQSEYKVLKKGFDHYKKHLLEKNNVDVFVHCWDTELEKHTTSLYNPVSCVFEEQVVFDVPQHVRGEEEQRKQNHYSRWYSNKKVNELRSAYEKANGFKYDYVMTSRFDLAFETDLVFEAYNPEYFYAGKWSAVVDRTGRDLFKGGRGPLYDLVSIDHPVLKELRVVTKGYPNNGEGFLDLWFFCSSGNSDKFFNLYNKLDDYTKPNQCPTDASGRISNHLLVKHHLQEIGMLDKVKFTLHMYDDFPEVRRKYYGCRK